MLIVCYNEEKYCQLLVTSQDYKILRRLVPVTFREKWMWGQEGFFSYYGIKNSVRDTTIDLTTFKLPVVKDTMYHTIKSKDNYVLIGLK